MSNVHWDLSDPVMSHTLRVVVQNKSVVEVGGAMGELADVMVNDMMADHVLVIEKERMLQAEVEKHPQARVHRFWGYVHDFSQQHRWRDKQWGVVVISWPPNILTFDYSVIPLMRRSAQVAILGKNDGFTACGTDVLWNYLITRERIHYVTGPRNDLVVYGPNPRPPTQAPVPIEEFGISYLSKPSCLTTSLRSQPTRS